MGEAKQEEQLTALERERNEIIAQNLRRFEEAGVFAASQKLSEIVANTPDEDVAKKKSKRKRKTTNKKENIEFRRQTRSQTLADRKTRSQNIETKLGDFLVTGICPKCKGIFSRHHRKHLEECQGFSPSRTSTPPPSRPPSRPPSVVSGDIWEQRIQQCSVTGLLSATDEEAKYGVVGSNGWTFQVTLKDDKQTCQCKDHRFRRRNCKHIRALLKELKLEDNPEEWRKVAK